jgi:uncharacterized membrane protein YoaK (UPF0700 family)
MPVTLGYLLLGAAGITDVAGFAITASTAAIVGNITLAGSATALRDLLKGLDRVACST